MALVCSQFCNRRLPVVLFALACLLPRAAFAAEVPSRDLLPPERVALVEVEQPLRILDHPLAGKLWEMLQESNELKRRYDSPEYDQLRSILALMKEEFGVGWREALEKVTAGGVLLAIEQGPPAKTTLVLTADTPETIAQFGTFLRKLGEAGALPDANKNEAEMKSQRDFPYYKNGDGYYAVAGRRLIVTNGDESMRSAIDRLLDGQPVEPVDVQRDPHASLLRVTGNMEALRKAPGVEETLKVPTTNIAQVFLLGDGLDLARRSKNVVVELTPAEQTLNLSIRFGATKSEVTPGLEGFFAVGEGQQAAPLLEVPDTLFSTSWFRDYAAIWEGRTQVLVETSLKAVDEGDQQVQNQLKLIGASFQPSLLLKSLGNHFRVVVARQQEKIYDVELDGRLPAAALVVDLKDEEYFTTKVVPAIRAGYGFATASQQPRLAAKQLEYKDAKLTSLIFDDSEQEAARGNKVRYQTSPTFTVTRGHFVFGSTREIVRQVIDELDRQQAEKPAELPAATSRQLTKLPTAANFAEEFQAPLVRNIVFGQGLSLKEAEHELDVVRRIVAGMGHVTVTSGFDETGYRYSFQLGPAGETAE